MHINAAGLALIKQYEGFSKAPYRCPAGLWTIGYGHTGGVHEHTTSISETQASELLARDVREAEVAVSELIEIDVNENQFSALVSLLFNIGRTNFAHSTLLKKLNAEEIEQAADEFLRWIYASGTPLQGLKNRRIAERELFLTEAS